MKYIIIGLALFIGWLGWFGYTRPGVRVTNIIILDKGFTAATTGTGTGITSNGKMATVIVSTPAKYTLILQGRYPDGKNYVFPYEVGIAFYTQTAIGTHFDDLIDHWYGFRNAQTTPKP